MGGNVLVTGGLGFIGRHLVKRLLDSNHNVCIIDNCQGQDQLPKIENIELVKDSILRTTAIQYAARNCETVFHLAGLRFAPDVIKYHEVNAAGTLSALDTCSKMGVKRFIAVSEVIGKTRKPPPDHYHASRRTAEMYVNLYHGHNKMQTVTLRLAEIFGPGQAAIQHFIVPCLIGMMTNHQDGILHTSPGYRRDFCYIDNAVDAMMLAGKSQLDGGCIDIGSGKSHSVEKLANTAKAIIKDCFIPKIVPTVQDRPWIFTGRVDISEAAKKLGYAPKVGFETGLRRYINSVRGPIL